jgi:hypothetical protein
MIRRFCFSLLLLTFSASASNSADSCHAVALRAVPAFENPTSVLKKGELDTAITQYRVNKKTGEGSFCSHGGYCYPSRVMENGISVEALKLTNCQIGKRDDFDDPDDIFYAVDVVRSKLSPMELKRDDVDNRLLDLGLCSACASNAAQHYVLEPQSQCARLVKEVLEGNPQALETLSSGVPYCDHGSDPAALVAACLVADPTGTPLNVRTGPYGRILGNVANGSRVTVIDRSIDRNGKNWVYVADQAGKPLGWLFREYITCH